MEDLVDGHTQAHVFHHVVEEEEDLDQIAQVAHEKVLLGQKRRAADAAQETVQPAGRHFGGVLRFILMKCKF